MKNKLGKMYRSLAFSRHYCTLFDAQKYGATQSDRPEHGLRVSDHQWKRNAEGKVWSSSCHPAQPQAKQAPIFLYYYA